MMRLFHMLCCLYCAAVFLSTSVAAEGFDHKTYKALTSFIIKNGSNTLTDLGGYDSRHTTYAATLSFPDICAIRQEVQSHSWIDLESLGSRTSTSFVYLSELDPDSIEFAEESKDDLFVDVFVSTRNGKKAVSFVRDLTTLFRRPGKPCKGKCFTIRRTSHLPLRSANPDNMKDALSRLIKLCSDDIVTP